MYLVWKSVGRLSPYEIHILDLKAFKNPSCELHMIHDKDKLSFQWEVLPGTTYSLHRLDYPGDPTPELVDEQIGTFGARQHTQAIGTGTQLFRLLRK